MDSASDFSRNGYCILPAVFSPDEVARMREDADFILQLILNSSIANERQSRRLDIRRRGNGGIVVRKIQPVLDLAPAIAEFANDDRLLGPLAELMADEPVLFEEKLNYKQPIPKAVATAPEMSLFQTPADDDRFPVHNDYAYYKYNNYPAEVISTALAIDDCRADNGPMLVFPGTHTHHVEHLRVRNGLEVPEGTVNGAEAVPVVAFFHSRLIHTSAIFPSRRCPLMSGRMCSFLCFPAQMPKQARTNQNAAHRAILPQPPDPHLRPQPHQRSPPPAHLQPLPQGRRHPLRHPQRPEPPARIPLGMALPTHEERRLPRRVRSKRPLFLPRRRCPLMTLKPPTASKS